MSAERGTRSAEQNNLELGTWNSLLMPSFVTHLESALDGTQLPADCIQTLHRDRPLWVRYNLDAVGRTMTKQKVASRAPTMWRYRELLPPVDDASIVKRYLAYFDEVWAGSLIQPEMRATAVDF